MRCRLVFGDQETADDATLQPPVMGGGLSGSLFLIGWILLVVHGISACGKDQTRRERQASGNAAVARPELDPDNPYLRMKIVPAPPREDDAADGAPTDTDAGAAEEASTGPSAIVTAPPEVKLLSQGSRPRRTLRYAFSPGQETHLDLDATFRKLEMTFDRQRGRAAVLPHVRYELDTIVREVDASGVARLAFTLGSAEVVADQGLADEAARELSRDLAGRGPITGRSIVDARGIVQGVEIDRVAASPQVTTIIDNLALLVVWLTLPLPEEPVGRDGSWEVSTLISRGGLTARQYVTFTVESLDQTTASFDIGMIQSAARQELHLAGIPPGGRAVLTKLSADGSGSASIAFERVVLSTLDLRADLAITMSLIDADGDAHDGETAVGVSFQIRPAR